ncbi:MAG: hypothetical protein D5R97_04360 [Candidatus Syntrophonatronum acetioxidans]|uniref:ABC transporter permease n=1 Tax=Candidatus Syntrophonatronum acetioxidans TaxID=1795816 RepID=A0A424YFC8_9FIRM|nr:MAG: hypothetical protein D5R97_04360 [Candidatus Syntrophonatronum acetioxidans]
MFKMSLFQKELRESRWKIIVGLIIFIITAASIPITFKYVKELFALVPEIPGLDNLEMFLENYNLYVWSQWQGKNLYQIGTILAVVMGMNLIAGEKVANTLEFLLAKPLSRGALYFTKFAAGSFSLALIVLGSTAVLYLASLVMGYELMWGQFLVATLITLLGLIFVFLLTLLISTVLDEPVKAGLLSALILLLLALPGWFQQTYRLSVFYHMAGGEYILEGVFPFIPLFVIILISTGVFFAGLKLFERKEP